MPINSFKHPIIDGIVDPEDQPVLDKYVVQRGVGASSIRDEGGRKRGGLHTVTLENGDKVEALWRGQRDLEDHTGRNLIKQTTSNGNTRYYMLLDRTGNKTIKDIVDMYIEYVSQNMANHVAAERYKFDSFIKFRDNFDINSEKFEEMLSRALPRNNLDGGGNYFPGKMIQVFAQANPEAVRGALRALSDTSLTVDERIGTYHTVMLELLDSFNRTTGKDNSGADDTRFISLLLSMISPSEFMNYKSTQLKVVFDAVRGGKENLNGRNVDKITKASQLGKELLAEFRTRPEFQEIKQQIAWDTADDNLWIAQDIYWVASSLLKKQATDVDIVPVLKRFIAQAAEGADFTRKQYSAEIAPGIGGYAVFQSRNTAFQVPFLIFGELDSRSVVQKPYIGFLYHRDKQKVYLIYSWPAPPEEQLEHDHPWKGNGYKLEFNEEGYNEAEINDRFNQLLTELQGKIKTKEDTMDARAQDHPLNAIYYGPPGTGKTYYINEIKHLLLGGQHSEARDPLAGIKTWNDAIVRVFADNNYLPLSVNDILRSEIMQTYAATRNSKSPYGTISTQILGNATESSTTSAYRLGTDKYEKVDGKWALTEAGRAEAEAMASAVQATEQHSSTVDKFFKFTTFHQSYGYEEFIEGIRPETDEGTGQLRYEIRDGVFKEFCSRAVRDPENKYLFVIDEINRANISKVFGELITLLEPSKRIGSEEELRVSLPYSGESFGVPANVYVVGTMNTADRSIALLDIALRRRFDFIEMMPRAELLSSDIEGVDLRQLLKAVNGEIVNKIDRNHQIGHSYLMHINTLDELHSAWYRRVVPLLQEYFYDDTDDLRSVIKSFIDNGEIVSLEGEEFKAALKNIYEETQNPDSGILL